MKVLSKLPLFLSLILFLGCNNVSSNSSEEELDLVNQIKQKLEAMLPESIILNSVSETDMEDFYEVRFEGIEPLYVSKDGEYLISGDIYQITREGLVNKSEARRDYQRLSALGAIPEEEMIVYEPELVKHSIYVFTDVDCGYCRQFHSKIDGYLSLGIKVKYLAFPRAGPGSESFRKMTSAWCAKDKQRAITDLKLGREVNEEICLEHPVEKHFELGRGLGVSGTPSIVTQSGKLIPGYLPPEELLNQLNSNS
jgi:thiol:disulfide interchange protein DsbC